MASIPLNIDAPVGVEFTVNRKIRVDSSGRIHVTTDGSYAKVSVKNGAVELSLLNAAFYISMALQIKEARLLAFEILKITDSMREQP